MFDLVGRRRLPALQQMLPREQGAVEGTLGENLYRHTDRFRAGAEPVLLSATLPAIRISTRAASWATGVVPSPMTIVIMASAAIRSLTNTGRTWICHRKSASPAR